MNIKIRPEEEKDYRPVEYITREAFWDLYKPGCNEHLIVHKMREVPAFIKELSFVACDEENIVGSIIYSMAKVVNHANTVAEVLCMGPISVLPSYQGKGVGSILMNHSVEKARELGYKAVIIFGNPGYYHKFGFVNAEKYNITTSSGENFEPFMALELFAGSLNGITGKFYEDKVFETEEKELAIFEKEFPYREKHVTDTQLK
jgi:predicted N-acetyltransferase YhbS